MVIPFCLYNAPAVFQCFMNNIFHDMVNVCITIYLNDILIYSNNPTQHKKHVQKVLCCLQLHGLYAQANKCEFNTNSVEYLGYVLSPTGLSMAQDKVKTIQDWPEPRKVKDIQSFFEFANFYHHVIWNYSEITVLVTCLTRKNIPWRFSEECYTVFEDLKQAFTIAPVLTYWVPDQQIVVETDALDYALSAVLFIYTNGDIHLVVYHSWTFTPLELNYDIHDKELLTIFKAFKTWRHFLEGSGTPIDVVTDHKNLEYFFIIKLLIHQQAHWSEFLSQFNLVI